MPAWLVGVLSAIGSILLSLTVTLIFNKAVGLPKELKKQKKLAEMEKEQLKKENQTRDKKIADIETNLPIIHQQSLKIRTELQETDKTILETCNKIQESVLTNQKILNQRLDRLEKREKNALRAKILADYRLFTCKEKNPKQAWSEMEHHSFFELVKDYEDLNGNDYVHSVVIPAMNELEVIPMSDLTNLEEMYKSRHI
jgi:hypothetical protein